MNSFQKSIRLKIEDFLAEKGVEQTTLTLNGTGVNGGMQYVILDAIGPERLRKLAAVNLVSGSVYSYLCYLAWQEGEMQFDLYDMKSWDKANRSWHQSSVLKGITRLIRSYRTKKPVFKNELLSQILANTVTSTFAARPVSGLPANCRIWTYNRTAREFVAITPDSSFKDCALAEVVRFSSSVPALYGYHSFNESEFLDPVYSGNYSALIKCFRVDAKAHLVANLFENRRKGDTLYIKPHPFKNPKFMLVDDFARLMLNIPNPRINRAHKIAFSR